MTEGRDFRNISETLLKNSFSEYTEAEFIKLLQELAEEDEEAENDERADSLLLHFRR